MSWPKKWEGVVRGVPPETIHGAYDVAESARAFAQHDFVRGAALAARSLAGFAVLAKMALPDKGACSDCGYHVCNCEVGE